MSLKKNIELRVAREIASDFQAKTQDLYRRCEVAGSIRRKENIVHDIDFAVIPSMADWSSWKEVMKERIESIGGRVVSFGETICDFLYRGVQVNLFVCTREDSWGITLMWATGPKGHTIGMNIKAKNKGMIVNSQGVFTRDEPQKRIPVPTEEEVGRVLGWKYKPPEQRGKGAEKDDLPW